VSQAEINRLPDPDLFRDALFLNDHGRWSPRELDETDALLLALLARLRIQSKRA
jgi:hypothetical protein